MLRIAYNVLLTVALGMIAPVIALWTVISDER